MSDSRFVERNEDMTPRGRLRLVFQGDGDVIVAIVPDPDEEKRYNGSSVEFCSVGGGGGRSRHTIEALRALGEAMERDNRESPIHRVY
jgi:hypothetical protein